MQEVFEKIIEKLEERKQLHERMIAYESKNGTVTEEFQARKAVKVVENAIEIVKQKAEKFGRDTNVGSNCWIPVSERLPDEAFGCLVTVMVCEPSTQTEFENILPYFVGYDGETWNDADGEEIPFEVVAWRKLPNSYQPKGD